METGLASTYAEESVSGLKTRLESIEGVQGILLELGDDGLEGITVRLSEGADELKVLDGVRRLLVAYGTRPARHLASIGTTSDPTMRSTQTADEDVRKVRHRVLDIDSVGSEMLDEPKTWAFRARSEREPEPVDRVELAVTPAGDRSTALVAYSSGDKTLTRQVPSSARAIVQSVLDMVAEMIGREPVTVIALNLSVIDGVRVLTVIAGNEGETPRVSTVSVVEGHWPASLLQMANQILEVSPE